MVDYSQHEQALILRQLITPETPRIVVDVGAHDGICGSNSRELLEDGWRGLLIEPMPPVFTRLAQNSRDLPNAKLVNVACGDKDGTQTMRIGRDGPEGQMGSFSSDPVILQNLSETSIDVPVKTLSQLLRENDIPKDFGVLLVDTEGWDLVVLEGLRATDARPRIIVTEDFSATDTKKSELLITLGYSCGGSWGGDSFWVSQRQRSGAQSIDFSRMSLPVLRLPRKWRPSGKPISGGQVKVDTDASFRYTITGWAWNESFQFPNVEVIVSLRGAGSDEAAWFRAWSIPRPDVAAAFGSPSLLMSGFRTNVNVAPGNYAVTIVQQGRRNHTLSPAGEIVLPVLNSALGSRSDSDYRYVCRE